MEAFYKQVHEEALLCKDNGNDSPEIVAPRLDEAKRYPDTLLLLLVYQHESLSPEERRTIHQCIRGPGVNLGSDDYIWLYFYGLCHYSYYPLLLPKLLGNSSMTTIPMICYNDKEIITIQKHLGAAPDQYVFQGIRLSDEQPVVIKWYKEAEEIEKEISYMNQACLARVPLPWFDTSYYFWDRPVLVMELLEPLTRGQENIRELGLQLLLILERLHTFAVHNDIKPENIMKKDSRYYLIDFGDIAVTPKGYGKERRVWSPLWSSQVPEMGQITTPKYDLIELVYTLRYLADDTVGDINIRNITQEPWVTLLNHIRRVPETRAMPYDFFRTFFMNI